MTAYTKQKAHLLKIVEMALEAVAPAPALRAALALEDDKLTVGGRTYDLSAHDRIFLTGAGKASAAMAHTMEDILGDRLHRGIVATKYGHGLELEKTVVMEAGHPVPDRAGELASRRMLELARETTKHDLVFCLLSGGASAIIPAPRQPVSLADKQATTGSLLGCGATINEINAIRKHLSRFKGGHFAKALEPSTVITLIISDVVGDHLDVIGSGPTAPDDSSFLDCRTILDKYRLCGHMPDAVVKAVNDGCAGLVPETRKAGDSCFDRVHNVIVAGNAMALNGAAQAARKLGYTPVVVDSAMEGEARDVAARLVRLAQGYCRGQHGSGEPVCLLAGGETTVTIRGKGKGGRNQELALAAAVEIAQMGKMGERLAILSLGTDGTDGPTDAAGAMAFPDTVARSGPLAQAARTYLEDNNAYAFLADAGTLVMTGPTRTNVMDVVAVLVDPA
ncbi:MULTISPECIES: glycerate kinase [unclassified Pseudodesulfovibrio]|uniref:glycerate kinase type-2 family protein n=1 Tax=unclassified Pseudodesulfovibrio TaxID=2661612 RepID=UPI000FEBEBBD|nr:MULTISPECIES: glycerate kinase [unclassified Pseudodesulfovibrio]MCJ2164467.1 glycerate kinase [Pseudodesulfovibrio sp. S3-i]RWU04668.1 glycerate kinase [Pseudodesulfovibrio sp. S3]